MKTKPLPKSARELYLALMLLDGHTPGACTYQRDCQDHARDVLRKYRQRYDLKQQELPKERP